MNRGDRRQPILCDKDRELCLQTLWRSLRQNRLAGPCLVPLAQSFHLVLGTPHPTLPITSPGMNWFLGTYTSRFNRRHKFLAIASLKKAVNGLLPNPAVNQLAERQAGYSLPVHGSIVRQPRKCFTFPRHYPCCPENAR